MYEALGVVPVINGFGTATRVSGSLMPEPVIAAMREASGSYVLIDELLAAAGRRIAQLTRNDAAYICSSATAGLVLATAACVSGDDPAVMAAFPHPGTVAGIPTKVVIHRCERFSYDFSVRSTGITFVEIGPTREESLRGVRTSQDELVRVLDGSVAAVLMVPNGPHTYGALPIGEVVKISHAHGVPVIVDAASQIPAVENLWHFSGNGGPAPWAHALLEAGVTENAPESVAGLGVDLAIFSGGKGLCGPAPTGLLLGRPDLIDSITRQGSPNPLIGRPMKVGKEEICGIVAAVEWYLATDFTALARRYEADVRTVIDGVDGIRGVVATRVWPSESGQPMPRALVTFGPEAPLTRDQMQVRLMGNRPRIAVWNEGDDGFHVNPQTLKPGEASVIADVLRRILRSA